MVSNTELSDLFAFTEFGGESSVSSSQPIMCVQKRTDRVVLRNSPLETVFRPFPILDQRIDSVIFVGYVSHPGKFWEINLVIMSAW